jgi:hypothetical protein
MMNVEAKTDIFIGIILTRNSRVLRRVQLVNPTSRARRVAPGVGESEGCA